MSNQSRFMLSEDQFNQMFPERDSVYSYAALVAAYQQFESEMQGATEALTLTNLLAFLANTSHETTGDGYNSDTFNKGLFFVVEGGAATQERCAINPGQTPWCAAYGLTPDGAQSYYGRGALQLSYESNYQAANQGIPNNEQDIFNDPKLVAETPYLAWATALWFWCTPQWNKPSCAAVINGQWQPNENDLAKGRVNHTFANRMGVVTDIINGGIEAGSWDANNSTVVPLTPADSQSNKQAIDRQQYYQYFVEKFFPQGAAETMSLEQYNTNQASHMANFNH